MHNMTNSLIFILLCLIAFQLLVQDLHRGDITVAAFNDLSNKLLREYRDDDTRRVKETTDQMNTCWVNLNQR